MFLFYSLELISPYQIKKCLNHLESKEGGTSVLFFFLPSSLFSLLLIILKPVTLFFYLSPSILMKLGR